VRGLVHTGIEDDGDRFFVAVDFDASVDKWLNNTLSISKVACSSACEHIMQIIGNSVTCGWGFEGGHENKAEKCLNYDNKRFQACLTSNLLKGTLYDIYFWEDKTDIWLGYDEVYGPWKTKTKKNSRKLDLENGERICIIYRILKTSNVYDKKQTDVVYVDDLLVGVFNVISDEHDIDKIYRLQRWTKHHASTTSTLW